MTFRTAAAALVLVQLLVWRHTFLSLGFVLDDWVFLHHYWRLGDGSLGGTLETFLRQGSWTRPLASIESAALYRLCASTPWLGQVALAGLAAAESCLLFALLARLTGRRELALLAACLAVVYPGRSTTHFWVSNAPQVFAHVLVLSSLLLHLARQPLIASQALYAAAVLSYESVLLLPAMAAAAEAAVSGRGALRRWAPYAGCAAALLAWQFLALPALGLHNPKADLLQPGLAFAAKALFAGLGTLTVSAAGSWRAGLDAVVAARDWAGLSAAALAAAVCAWAALAPGRPDAAAGRALPAAAAAAFVASYAPFALSGSYMPKAAGIMNRVNGSGVWAGAVLLAFGLSRLKTRSPRLAAAACAVLVLGWACAGWTKARDWRASWALQRRVLSEAAGPAKSLPPGSELLVVGFPPTINGEVVFVEKYDFDYALRLTTRREDLRGLVREYDLDRSSSPPAQFVFDLRSSTLSRARLRR